MAKKRGPGFLPLFILVMAMTPLFARGRRKGNGFCKGGIVCVGGTDKTAVEAAVYAMQQEGFPHEVVPIEVMSARGMWIQPDEQLAYQVVNAKDGEKHEYPSSLHGMDKMAEMLVDAMHIASGT